VLVDNGTVVGVGRATRIPPGWLTDAVLAIHDTCVGPVCDRPALGADIDHAARGGPSTTGPAGPPISIELGPLCADTNQTKEAAGWRAEQRRRAPPVATPPQRADHHLHPHHLATTLAPDHPTATTRPTVTIRPAAPAHRATRVPQGDGDDPSPDGHDPPSD
jgi:hypothetical protein